MRRFFFERNPFVYVFVVSLTMGIVVTTLIKDLQLMYLRKLPAVHVISVVDRYMANYWAPWLPWVELALIVFLLWAMPTVKVSSEDEEHVDLEIHWALEPTEDDEEDEDD